MLKLDLGPRTESQRLALLLKRLDQAGVFERHRAELVEHGLHLAHRVPRRAAHQAQRFSRPGLVLIEAGLHRGGGRLDDEDLLLDGIVQIARQAGALLLAGRSANLLLVFGP